jgi:hypothetical protein
MQFTLAVGLILIFWPPICQNRNLFLEEMKNLEVSCAILQKVETALWRAAKVTN